MLSWTLIFLFYLTGYSVLCANILAVNTLASPSHHLFHDVYLLELAKRGHNVTLLGHNYRKHNISNYNHLVMEGFYEKISHDDGLATAYKYGIWETIQQTMWYYNELTCLHDHGSEAFKLLTNYPENFKFDLIIWDINAGYCHFPLVEKFGKPPVIGVDPFIGQPDFFRNVYQSYIPYFALPYSDHMTFWQRLKSNFWHITTEISKLIHFYPRNSELAQNYFGKTNMTLAGFIRHIDLLLVNHNPVFNYVKAFPPNIIPIGGVHIKDKKPLPEDLKSIVDNAKDGVIIFSFGTNVKITLLDEVKINAILHTLSRLNQTVLWRSDLKWTNPPKNVHISPWLPQNDLLGHPNVILFITHGGLLSSHEVVYNGVPVVVVPFYLDQIQNARNFVEKSIGEIINLEDFNAENFFGTIQKVLQNKSYSQNAKRLSMLYKDQPRTPLDTVIFWIEYVLRHGSPRHLNMAVRDINLFQVLNLDLFLIAFSPLLLLSGILGFCISNICRNHKRLGNKLKTS